MSGKSEDAPKSAYELAMERLRSADEKEGREPAKALTARQKKEIHELRQTSQAKLAELEILHQKELAAILGDPEKLPVLDEHYRIDRRRVESALESEIARVKAGRSK